MGHPGARSGGRAGRHRDEHQRADQRRRSEVRGRRSGGPRAARTEPRAREGGRGRRARRPRRCQPGLGQPALARLRRSPTATSSRRCRYASDRGLELWRGYLLCYRAADGARSRPLAGRRRHVGADPARAAPVEDPGADRAHGHRSRPGAARRSRRLPSCSTRRCRSRGEARNSRRASQLRRRVPRLPGCGATPTASIGRRATRSRSRACAGRDRWCPSSPSWRRRAGIVDELGEDELAGPARARGRGRLARRPPGAGRSCDSPTRRALALAETGDEQRPARGARPAARARRQARGGDRRPATARPRRPRPPAAAPRPHARRTPPD